MMTTLDEAIQKLRKQLKGVQLINDRQTYLVELMADNNKAMNDKLDGLQSTVDNVQEALRLEREQKAAAKAAQDQLIADLREQLAQGPSGLTEEQVNAAIDRIQAINDDVLTSTENLPSTGEPGETPIQP